jgi:YhcN/YlaJ family sporulation lipoprotein
VQQYARIVLGAVWVLVLALGLTGCGNGAQERAQSGDQRPQSMTNSGNGNNNNNGVDVATHLEMLARGVPGVNDANCVVFGNYAIVGIDVGEQMDRSHVGTLKYAVAEAFRKDPVGVDALVTADMDLAQRIREIRADVNNGRPIAGFTEELGDIVGRLIPQIPRGIVPPRGPDNTGTGNANRP